MGPWCVQSQEQQSWGSRAEKQGPDRAAAETFQCWSWQAAVRKIVFVLALQLSL